MKILKFVGWVAVVFALTFALVEFGLMMHTSRQELVKLAVLTNNLNDVVTNLKVVEDKELAASAQQINTWQQIGRETAKSVADLHDLLIHTDLSLNGRSGKGGVLPALTAMLNESIKLEATAGRDLDSTIAKASQTIDDLKPTLLNLAKASEAAANTMADPSIKVVLANAATSSDNLAKATGEAVATLNDVHKAADYELKQLLAPVSKVKAAALFSVRLVGRLLGF